MIADAIHPPAAPPPAAVRALPAASAAPDAASFDAALARQVEGEDVDAARDAVTKLVSSVFVAPILASLRESPLREGPFAAGMGERRFGPLFDVEIADRVTKAARFGLVDAILDRYRIAEHLARRDEPSSPGDRP